MKTVTLCFLVRENEICLAMKKRGFGEGKLNGIGGKVEESESIEAAAVRELHEEIGVKANSADLKHAGHLKFYFDEQPDWNQHMHIYFLYSWQGEPSESDEMRPEWHSIDALPYESMWIDDQHWLPKVLAGEKIQGEFRFNNTGDRIETFEIGELV